MQEMELLNTSEAARYLRLGGRKLYELVAEGAIPCTKMTGEWLFPREQPDRCAGAGGSCGAGASPRPFTITPTVTKPRRAMRMSRQSGPTPACTMQCWS